MQTPETTEFIAQAIFRMEENLGKIEKCLKDVREEEVWKRPNEASNSLGNLLIHLSGNITQYIISGVGGAKDIRERDKEFNSREGSGKKILFEKLERTIHDAIKVLQEMGPKQFLGTKVIQGTTYTGIGNVLHVVEHLSYHTGQIAFWVKLLRDKDLAFYTAPELNERND